MARRRNKGEEKAIVRHRLHTLMDRARTEASGPDVDLANRYVGLAMRLARRYQQPLGVHKLSMCRACATYRSPATARTRIHRNRVVITCLQCGEIRRRPL